MSDVNTIARLDRIEAMVREIHEALTKKGAAPDATTTRGEVADDLDLDGPNGDPIVKYEMKEKWWKGGDQTEFIGLRFSECPPDYLKAMARYFDACAFMARKNGDERKASYKERDASRARGWMIRNQQSGAGAQRKLQAREEEDLGDLPF